MKILIKPKGLEQTLPLFDDLAELCDAWMQQVWESGAQVTHLNEEDGEGQLRRRVMRSQLFRGLGYRMIPLFVYSFTLCWLMKYVQRSGGMTHLEKSAPKKQNGLWDTTEFRSPPDKGPTPNWHWSMLPCPRQCQGASSGGVTCHPSIGIPRAKWPRPSGLWRRKSSGWADVLMKDVDLFRSDLETHTYYGFPVRRDEEHWLHHELTRCSKCSYLVFLCLPVENSF